VQHSACISSDDSNEQAQEKKTLELQGKGNKMLPLIKNMTAACF
jgi:hypothetical protein